MEQIHMTLENKERTAHVIYFVDKPYEMSDKEIVTCFKEALTHLKDYLSEKEKKVE